LLQTLAASAGRINKALGQRGCGRGPFQLLFIGGKFDLSIIQKFQ
jgi:hypothetical protein